MDKWTKMCALAALLVSLAACQLTPEQGGRILATVENVAARIDRDLDGVVTNREIKDSGGDVGMWTGILGGLLGLLGAGGAAAARSRANEVKRDTDALWDATHSPVVKS